MTRRHFIFPHKTKLLTAMPWWNGAGFNANAATDITFTTQTAPVSDAINACAFATKNYVYVLGANPSANFWRAPINPDGTLGTWVQQPNFPVTVAAAKAIITNGYVHILSAKFGGAINGAVYSAPINSDGTLGAWVAGPTQAVAAYRQVLFYINPYLYAAGGYNPSDTGIGSVNRCQVKADGSLGPWSTYGTSLPSAYGDAQAVETSGYIHLVGGSSNGAGNLTNWYSAKKNADGTPGAWTPYTAPAGKGNPAVIATKNYIFVMGGDSSSFAVTNTKYRAPINADGSLGAWTALTNLPSPLFIGVLGVVLTSSKAMIFGASSDLGSTLVYMEASFTGGLNDYTPAGVAWQ